MDLLKTILVYMSLVFATSVQNAPEPSLVPEASEPAPTPYVEVVVTPTPSPKPTPVPTINITPNPAYKTIKVGDNGDQVRELQEKLAAYGYYAGDIDGRFGNQTRRAVEAFQYQHGLSADGIAGRNTLTVLYESNEVRMAPTAEETPRPVETIAAAVTEAPTASPEPTAEPEAEPTQPVETPKPTETPAPVATPLPEFLPLEGSTIRLIDNETPLTAAAEEGKEGEVLMAYVCGDSLYLPLPDLLRAAGVNVISSTSVEKDEYAFAMGQDIIRISFTEDQAGQPMELEAFKNNEPQILPGRDIRLAQGTYYLPLQSLESLLGLSAQLDREAAVVTVAFPQIVQQ